MKRVRGVNIVLGSCAVALITSSAWADVNAFLGHWHWNSAQSTLPPGEPAPNDLTAEILRSDDQHLTWSVTIVTSDGQSHVETFDGATNGEFHPISNGTT